MWSDDSCCWINHGCFTKIMHQLTTLRASSSREEYRPTGTTFLFPRSCSGRLFFFHQLQVDHQEDPFWRHESHQGAAFMEMRGVPTRILAAILKIVAEKDGKLHYSRGELLWRRNHVLFFQRWVIFEINCLWQLPCYFSDAQHIIYIYIYIIQNLALNNLQGLIAH